MMFFDDLLIDYTKRDHFFFSAEDDLTQVCNAPKSGAGVYLVYQLRAGKIQLVYIGAAGKVLSTGKLKTDKGGIYGEIVNGQQFNDSRISSWPEQLKRDGTEALDVYWYETWSKKVTDIPSYVQTLLLQNHLHIMGDLPKWNKEI